MEIAVKIIQAVLPLVIDLIKQHHPFATDDAHKKIIHDLIDDNYKN